MLRCTVGLIIAAMLMGAGYATTAMASSIGLIDTTDMLDIRSEADGSSEVVGQVMDEGHVAILARESGWVQIQAGDIIGWVPEANLIETEISNEEAVEANEKVIAQLAEEAMEQQDTANEEVVLATEAEQAEAFAKEVTANSTEAFSEAEAAGEESRQEETQAQEEAQRAAEEEAQRQAEEAQRAAEEEAKRQAEEAQRAAEEAKRQAEEAQRAAEEEAQRQAEEEAQRAAEEAAQRAAEEAQRAAEEEAQRAAEEAQRQAESAKQAVMASAGVTEEDLYLLANIIYCEAGGEPYVGKVAVGSVVMNRVEHSKYPDTIEGVVYDKGQFSPVSNGKLSKALKYNKADESCYRAAMEALSGAEPVGDKLFFRRNNGRSGQVIGHHVFY